LRERSGWSRWHIEEHLNELVKAGYITQKIGRKGQRYAYSLVDDTIPKVPDLKVSI
jgi:DNA-binding IscR family transcriptional regulator